MLNNLVTIVKRLVISFFVLLLVLILPGNQAYAALSFGNLAQYSVGESPYFCAVGDIDGDGHEDIITSNYASDNISILYGRGDGTFNTKIDYSVPDVLADPRGIAAGDLDGDGRDEVVVTNYQYTGRVTIFKINSDRTVNYSLSYGTSSPYPRDVSIEDIDGDSFNDIIISQTNTISIYWGEGSGDFTVQNLSGAQYAADTAFADFNGDGLKDIVVGCSFNYIYLFTATGARTFGSPTQLYNSNNKYPETVATADFNNDGHMDIVSAPYYDSSVYLFSGKGDGTFQFSSFYGNPSYAGRVVSADFDNDGWTDIGVSCNSVGALFTFSNLEGIFRSGVGQTKITPGLGYGLATGDFNEDGKTDLVCCNDVVQYFDRTPVNTVSVFLNTYSAPPVISAISDVTIEQDCSTGDISFTISDDDTASANLNVWAYSSNLSLVPNNPNIRLGGSGSNRTIRVTPVTGAYGTATITVSVRDSRDKVTTRTFNITVKGYAELAAADRAALNIIYAPGDSAASVTQDLTLPVSGANGSTITWSSSSYLITGGGELVLRPGFEQGDASVTMTATITKGTESTTKTFNITVAKLSADASAEADKALLGIDYEKGENASSVKSDVWMLGVGEKGSIISWESSDPSVITITGGSGSSATGVVTRPSYLAGNKTVTLTATITSGAYSVTKTFELTVIKLPITDAESIQLDAEALEITYGAGDSAGAVTQDLTLPASGANGTTVTWGSSNEQFVSDTGEVLHRPGYEQGDAPVTMTATITKGTESTTKTFNITVAKLSAETSAEADKAQLEIGYKVGDSAASVTQDLTLAGIGGKGSIISWTSSDTSVAVVVEGGSGSNASGVVTCPSYLASNKTVTLAATITSGAYSVTKTFVITVIKLPITDAESILLDAEALAITYGAGDSAGAVTQDLTLAGSGANGTTVTWGSSNTGFITDGGELVLRPGFEQGDASVTMTATITKGTERTTKAFYITVAKLSADTSAEADKAQLEIGYKVGDSAASVTQDLTLAGIGGKGSTITWESSDPTVITITGGSGVVTCPSYLAGNKTVTLAATIVSGTSSVTKTFEVTVLCSSNLTVIERLNIDKDSLGISFSEGDSYETVTDDLTLLTLGVCGSSISWNSDNQTVISNTGEITRPNFETGDITVTITAELKILEIKVTKAFIVTVIKGEKKTDDNGLDVYVNGKKQENIATAVVENINGRNVTTILIDEEKLKKKLDNEDDNCMLTIPIHYGADEMTCVLNGRIVKNMEQKRAIIEIRGDSAYYRLPASLINIDEVSAKLGPEVELEDIIVEITIVEAPAEAVKAIEQLSVEKDFSFVAQPVEFRIKCIYQNETIDVSRFASYVERVIEIPEGVDPEKVTTCVIIGSDNKISHLPTKVEEIDGKYYAKVQSPITGVFAIIWNPVRFVDIDAHWAKRIIDEMGSRLIIEGIGNGIFDPLKDITRAEFAAILVRALGLEQVNGSESFTDVDPSAWYAGYVSTAAEYNLILGYGNGEFRPDLKITREQAMLILSRAMGVTNLQTDLTEYDVLQVLGEYKDVEQMSQSSYSSVAACIKAGIINGKGNGELKPSDYVSRSEVAVMVYRLLRNSGLI